MHGLPLALEFPPKRGYFLRFLCLEPPEPDFSVDLLDLLLNRDLPPVDRERREVLEALRPPFFLPRPLDLGLPRAAAAVRVLTEVVPLLASSRL